MLALFQSSNGHTVVETLLNSRDMISVNLQYRYKLMNGSYIDAIRILLLKLHTACKILNCAYPD